MYELKIFICGNFGYKNNIQIGGQHAKTRELKNAIMRKIGKENVSYVDTAYIRSNPLIVFKKINVSICSCFNKKYYIFSSYYGHYE